MYGGVLHSINTRMDVAIIAFQLDHARSKIVIVDREFMLLMRQALALAMTNPVLIQYDDPEFDGPELDGPRAEQSALDAGATDYEAFLAGGDPSYAWLMPEGEWDAISINYPSGTAGDPKGDVSHHRGAYFFWRRSTRSLPQFTNTPSICGRSVCSTATGDAFPGPCLS